MSEKEEKVEFRICEEGLACGWPKDTFFFLIVRGRREGRSAIDSDRFAATVVKH